MVSSELEVKRTLLYFVTGFNAAVAGCFFAVESVLWPSSSTDSSTSLPNTTSMVILSAVTASVVSEIGLGSEPAFKVPDYDFRSPGGNIHFHSYAFYGRELETKLMRAGH